MTDSTNDYEVQAYQDDLDTNQEKTDPLMNELNDDVVETLGVPAKELRAELDKRDLDSADVTDDMRQEIEGLDEDGDER